VSARRLRLPLFSLLLVVTNLLLVNALRAQVSVTTERYDGARTGANLNETMLTTSNVNTAQFRRLFSCTVDESVQAQPLFLSHRGAGNT
jgi:hypothetical protein